MENDETANSGGGEESASEISYIPLADLLKETEKVKPSKENIDENRVEAAKQTLKERETSRRGNEQYFKLRNKWSKYIARFVGFMLIFQALLTAAIGFGWVDFTHYKTYLHLVIGENFAQIIGMGYIVAKHLFPNEQSHS